MTHGKCHLCTDLKIITFCVKCHHWFCGECRKKYWHRGIAAIREMLGPSKLDCCGPIRRV